MKNKYAGYRLIVTGFAFAIFAALNVLYGDKKETTTAAVYGCFAVLFLYYSACNLIDLEDK